MSSCGAGLLRGHEVARPELGWLGCMGRLAKMAFSISFLYLKAFLFLPSYF
jgi:hypothetical protein